MDAIAADTDRPRRGGSAYLENVVILFRVCWLLGLGRPDRSLLAGVGDRDAAAGRLLLGRLAGAGLRVALGPRLAGQATGPVTVTRVP